MPPRITSAARVAGTFSLDRLRAAFALLHERAPRHKRDNFWYSEGAVVKPIKVTNVRFSRTPSGGSYHCDVSGLAGLSYLTHDVRSSTGHPKPATSAAWVAIGLLLPAMRTGRCLEIEGKLPGLLLHLLRSDIQALLHNFDPGLKRIPIECDIADEPPQAAGPGLRVATGFSAGVDSFAAVKWFEATGTQNALKVTDLFTFDVGAFNTDLEGQTRAAASLFNGAADRVSSFATATDRHYHIVQSNIVNAYRADRNYEFIRTHTMRNASAAALFEHEIDAYLYASGYDYSDMNLTRSSAIANIDAILLPMISPGRMRMISANAGEARVEKTIKIASDPVVRSMLDVCAQRAKERARSLGATKNCSRCAKCYRTMATLDAIGEIDNFAGVFDVPYYRKNRDVILADLRRRAAESPIDRSIAALFTAA